MSTQSAPKSAVLKVISLGKLMSSPAAVAAELLAACTDTGLFYLDCTDWENGSLSASQIQRLFQISNTLYDLQMSVGYKAAGVGSGPVEGRKDGFEGFMIFEHPLRNIADPTTMAAPGPLQTNGNFTQTNITALRGISHAMLDSLSQSLGLTGKSHLASTHRAGETSTTALGLLKYLPYGTANDVGHVAHTDAGSLSFVITDVAGLQVAMTGTDEWTYILPRDSHAIINVGGSLHLLSQGRLSRVRIVWCDIRMPSNRTKYTIVYLVRPETDAVFIDGDGKEGKSKDWYLKKFEAFGKGEVDQSHSSVLTGRKNHDGRLESVDCSCNGVDISRYLAMLDSSFILELPYF